MTNSRIRTHVASLKEETPLCQQRETADCYFSVCFFALIICYDTFFLTLNIFNSGEKHNQTIIQPQLQQQQKKKIGCVSHTYILLGPMAIYLGEPPK